MSDKLRACSRSLKNTGVRSRGLSQLSLTNFTTLITVKRLALISWLIVVGEGNNYSDSSKQSTPSNTH